MNLRRILLAAGFSVLALGNGVSGEELERRTNAEIIKINNGELKTRNNKFFSLIIPLSDLCKDGKSRVVNYFSQNNKGKAEIRGYCLNGEEETPFLIHFKLPPSPEDMETRIYKQGYREQNGKSDSREEFVIKGYFAVLKRGPSSP